jgi:hypothetical protein
MSFLADTNYKGIDNLTFKKLWVNYTKYINDVRQYGTLNISLRDKDRLLWGKSFYEQLINDLKVNFNIKGK